MLIGSLVTLAFLATALSFGVTSAWLGPEVHECRKAKEAASSLIAAALDEETGVRGYVLTRDPHFLEPYLRGELALARANQDLDAHAAAIGSLVAELVRTRATEQRWHDEWARPAAEMPPGGSPPSSQNGKSLFDAFRVEQTELASGIALRTEILSRWEQKAIGVRVALDLVTFTSLLIVAVRQHRALRAAIVAPVAALLREIGRVRDGKLVTMIHESGLSELRQLAEGLNDMVRALALAREVSESRNELVREHSIRLRQILDASREFSESLNLAYVVRSVRSSTMALGGYAQVIVWLMDDDQKSLRHACSMESALIREEPDDSTPVWRAAKSGRVTFEGPDGRARFDAASADPLCAIVVPLIVGARVVGALEARYAGPQAANGEALEVLEMLATHAATALESARLNQISEERSQMDPLTRLHNRRRLEEDLDAECARCVRYGRPLAFVMLDVDHFKAFNDAHGHPQGDTVLQEVAGVIGGAVRSTDTAYRYGGEEFCVLLRETSGENATLFAERLRQRVEHRFSEGTAPGC